jgi:hypothetical protein
MIRIRGPVYDYAETFWAMLQVESLHQAMGQPTEKGSDETAPSPD